MNQHQQAASRYYGILPDTCIKQSCIPALNRSNTYNKLNTSNDEPLNNYILNDYTSDYKSRLLKLHILPLMYTLDLNDIMFFIKNLKTRHDGFDIKSYISFVTGNTRLATSNKLQHNRSTDMMANNFYFNRLPRLRNALPIIDINLHPDNIKQKLLHYFWNHLKLLLIHQIPVTLLFSAVAPSVTINPPPLTLIFSISFNNLYNIHNIGHRPSQLRVDHQCNL